MMHLAHNPKKTIDYLNRPHLNIYTIMTIEIPPHTTWLRKTVFAHSPHGTTEKIMYKDNFSAETPCMMYCRSAPCRAISSPHAAVLCAFRTWRCLALAFGSRSRGVSQGTNPGTGNCSWLEGLVTTAEFLARSLAT